MYPGCWVQAMFQSRSSPRLTGVTVVLPGDLLRGVTDPEGRRCIDNVVTVEYPLKLSLQEWGSFGAVLF